LSLQREQRHAPPRAAFGLPADEWSASAWRLSCTTSVASVPDHILTKPGRSPMTSESRCGLMRAWAPRSSSRCRSRSPWPRWCATITNAGTAAAIRGLRGADIPSGPASWRWSITSRPSPPSGVQPGHAGRRGRQRALAGGGNALDPAVVSRYVNLLPALRKRRGGQARGRAERPAARYRDGEALLAGRPSRRTPSALLDDIGVATRNWAPSMPCRSGGHQPGRRRHHGGAQFELDRLVPFSTVRCFCTTRPTRVALPVRVRNRHKAFPAWSSTTARVGRLRDLRRECIVNGDPAAISTWYAATSPGGPEVRDGLPLMMGSTIRGALALYHTVPRAFTDEHRRLVSRVAGRSRRHQQRRRVRADPRRLGDRSAHRTAKHPVPLLARRARAGPCGRLKSSSRSCSSTSTT